MREKLVEFRGWLEANRVTMNRAEEYERGMEQAYGTVIRRLDIILATSPDLDELAEKIEDELWRSVGTLTNKDYHVAKAAILRALTAALCPKEEPCR
jgi:hypothetical protein